MNEPNDLALELSELRGRKRRVGPGQAHALSALRGNAVQRGVAFEQLNRQFSAARQKLIDQGRELRNKGVGAFGRKPLHAGKPVPLLNDSFPLDRGLDVTLLAFGFKFGAPPELDLLFDVRFLQNPNYDPRLESKTGTDPQVAAFIERDPALKPFLVHLFDLLDFLLPVYAERGKTEIVIGFGCTGGRHRSVYVAQRVFAHLNGDTRYQTSFVARDVERR